MKVLLVGNYAEDNQFSILQFERRLQSDLPAHGVQVTVTRPPARLLNGRNPHASPGKWLSFVDKFFLFPRHLAKLATGYDLVHICEHGYASYVHALQATPHLVTCHDLIVARAALGEIPDWPVSKFGVRYQAAIVKGLRAARHVACVSEATRSDVLRLSGRSKETTHFVYNGQYRDVSPMTDSEVARHLGQLGIDSDQKFLLHLSGNQPNKNRVGALHIYLEILRADPTFPYDFLMAGAKFTGKMQALADSAPPGRIRSLVRPSDDEVRALYARASAFLYPSLYEGFGLPIIEAQANGCPVITSDRAPMNEVCGSGVVLIDPTQPSAAADRILATQESWPSLVSAGAENAAQFTSERMVSEYAALYRNLLKA